MLKKILSSVLCLVILATTIPVTADAQTVDAKQNIPLYNGMESTEGIAGSGEVATLSQDKKVGKYAVRVVTGNVVNDYFSYKLGYSATPFNLSDYSKIRIWIKPAQGAKWVKFWVKNEQELSEALIKNDKDTDGIFKVGQDLLSGKWNLVTLDLSSRSNKTMAQLTTLWAQTNDQSAWLFDEVHSVYAPIVEVKPSDMINDQTKLVNGDLQFKTNGTGTYNTTPTVLISNNDYGGAANFSRESQAYKEDGSQVGNNMPRYERGYFHNLLTDKQAEVTDMDQFSKIGGASIERDVSRPYDGETSMKIRTSSSVADGVTTSSLLGVKVSPNKDYTAQVMATGQGRFKLYIRWYDQSGSMISDSSSQTASLYEDWQKVIATGTAPSNAATARLLWRTTVGEAVTCWIDCLQFEEGPISKEWVLPTNGTAIQVEESTTNLFDNPSFLTNSLWGTATWHSSGGINNGAYYINGYLWGLKQNKTVMRGAVYTVSVFGRKNPSTGGPLRIEILAPSTENITVLGYSNESTTYFPTNYKKSVSFDIPNDGNWHRLYLTFRIEGSGQTDLSTYLLQSGGTGSIDIARPQLEEKNYATSFIDGTRANENLKISIDTLTPKEGTWEQWTYINSTSKRSITGQRPTIFYIPRPDGGAGIWLYHNSSSWFLETRDDGGYSTQYSVSDSVTPEGWHKFTVNWTSTEVKLFINNILQGSLSNPKLPTSFGSNAYVGGRNGIVDILNTKHDNVRISSKAKTDEQIINSNNYQTYYNEDEILYKLDANLNGITQEKSTILSEGQINRISVDSFYLDGSGRVEDISSRPVIKDSRITKAYMSGDGNRIFYSNPDDSNRLWVLDLLTGTKQNVSFDKVPATVKTNYDGTKIAFKDANNVLYFTDLIKNSLSSEVSQSVRDFEVSTDGTLFYLYRDESSSSAYNVKLFKYSNSTSTVRTSGISSGSQLAVSKDGRKVYYSLITSIAGDEYVNGIWASVSSNVPSVGKEIWDMWTSFDGNYLYYQATGGYYIFDVSNNTSRKINVPAYKDIIRVINDKDLLLYVRGNYNYEVYHPETDTTELIRPEDAINYNGIDADDTGLKLAYPSSTGIKIKNLGKVTRPERYLLSFDGKNTWLSYKKGTWTEIKVGAAPESADFDKYGLTIDEVNALTEADFSKLYEDGREIYNFDVAIYFASTDAFITPSLKGITVTMKPSEATGGGESVEKALYTTKSSPEFNSTNWRQIKKIYPVEIQPREAEVYYFVYSNGTYYNFANNQLTALPNQSLLSNVEPNWIDITQQGLTADQLRNLPTETLAALLNKKFQIVYAMKVLDQSTEAYSSLITVDYVEQQFANKGDFVNFTISLSGEAPVTYNLTREQAEDFMLWVSERQNNRGPVFYRLPGHDVFINYYMLISVKVS